MLLGGLIEFGPRVVGAQAVLRAHGIRVLDSAACAAELGARG